MPETETADEILRTIRQLVRRISEHSRYLSRNVGLTVPQLMCLKAIGELEEAGSELITVAQVAKEVQLSPATVSRILDRLVNVSSVSRQRSEKDRRKVSLTLTPAGLERYQTLPTMLQERFLTRLAELPAKERTQLLGSLRRIAELMDATDLDAAPLLAPGAEPEPPTS
jgi:DNA-binding MarR family transcriptional regulator